MGLLLVIYCVIVLSILNEIFDRLVKIEKSIEEIKENNDKEMIRQLSAKGYTVIKDEKGEYLYLKED